MAISVALTTQDGQWRGHGGGGIGGRVPPLTTKNFGIGEKREQIRKKEEKSGRKGKNREGSFTLPLLTDRAGYATGTGNFHERPAVRL